MIETKIEKIVEVKEEIEDNIICSYTATREHIKENNTIPYGKKTNGGCGTNNAAIQKIKKLQNRNVLVKIYKHKFQNLKKATRSRKEYFIEA